MVENIESPHALVRRRQYDQAVALALSWIDHVWGSQKQAHNGKSQRSSSRGRSRGGDGSASNSISPPPASLKSDILVPELRDTISSLCMEMRYDYANVILKKCKEVGPPSTNWNRELQLSEIIDIMIKRRRFELASRAIEDFEVLDEKHPDFGCLNKFMSCLIAQKQYRLAMQWTGKLELWQSSTKSSLPVDVAWNPASLISAMGNAGDYEETLKYIAEYKLQDHYPVSEYVDALLLKGQFNEAMRYINIFNLVDPRYEKRILVDGMLNAKCWENAMTVIKSTKNHTLEIDLSVVFPNEELIRRMVMAHDWSAAAKYITSFNIKSENPEHKVLLSEFIRELISAGELHKAMKYTVKHKLEDIFPRKMLIQTMIDLGQHQHALYYMKYYKIEDQFQDQMPRIQLDRIDALRAHRALMKHRNKRIGSNLNKRFEDGVYRVVRELVYSTSSSVVQIVPNPKDEECIQSGPRFMYMIEKSLREPANEQKEADNESTLITDRSYIDKYESDEEDDDEEILLLASKPSPSVPSEMPVNSQARPQIPGLVQPPMPGMLQPPLPGMLQPPLPGMLQPPISGMANSQHIGSVHQHHQHVSPPLSAVRPAMPMTPLVPPRVQGHITGTPLLPPGPITQPNINMGPPNGAFLSPAQGNMYGRAYSSPGRQIPHSNMGTNFAPNSTFHSPNHHTPETNIKTENTSSILRPSQVVFKSKKKKGKRT